MATAPDTARAPGRLDRKALRMLIARRLAALDQPADFIDPSAVETLVDYAKGSPRRLRAGLAATLFLASTEDAPQVDALMVTRALQTGQPAAVPPEAVLSAPVLQAAVPQAPVLQAVIPPAGPRPLAAAVPARPRLTHSRLILVLSLSALAASLSLAVVYPPGRKPPQVIAADVHPSRPSTTPVPENPLAAALPAAVPSASSPAAAPAPAASAPLASTAAPPVTADSAPANPVAAPGTPAKPALYGPPAPPAGLAPLPPPVVVAALAVPPNSAPAPAAAATPAAKLPAGATPAILLLYPARDPGALVRLRPIALQLQEAGLKDIRARPTHAPTPRRAISYFYSDDRALAELIARTLSAAGWPRLTGNLLQPSLVLLPTGLSPRNPGTVEVQLP